MSFRLNVGCVCSFALLLATAGSACAQTPGNLPVFGTSSNLIDSGIPFITGSGNLGLGQNTLQNPTGSLNTAFGGSAMFVGGGSVNSAFGYAALQNNVGGSANMAIGADSLQENYLGNNNVGIGMYALQNNYAGNSNTAIGFQSLQSLGTGNAANTATQISNTAIGTNSLTGITSGTDNVAIGDGAGDDVAIGGGTNNEADQSIYLGASSMPQNSGEQNEIVIGWMAQGNGSNTVTLGNNSVLSTYLKGSLFLGGTFASIKFPDTTEQATAWNGVLSGGDYAESVNVSGDRDEYEAGDVLVIDPASEGSFLKSSLPYSTAVTGIYSTKPGVIGRRQLTARAHMKEEVPMAMTGIVPTKVSAENGPIRPGDLLVTSSKPGYAMKGTDRTQMLGAVIGKAIGHLDSGLGVIEAVVTLQ